MPLFEAIARRDPVVMVFEELQAADQALLDFIAHLLEWATRRSWCWRSAVPMSDWPSWRRGGDEIRLEALADEEIDAAGARRRPRGAGRAAGGGAL